MCNLFSKGTQPFDFIRHTIIQKLAYKVKYMSLRLDCEEPGKNQYKKKEGNQHSSVFIVLR